MARYSDTPLVKKLGIKPGFNVALVNAPRGLASHLQIPGGVTSTRRSKKSLDFVLLFVRNEKELKKQFKQLTMKLKPDGMLWVGWPKKSSGVVTDLTFTNVQAFGLATGLVDVKICAIDDIWSGLKFVYRLKDRTR